MAEEIFDESHYFVCSGGLKPARFKSGQDIMLKEDGNYYLTEYSLKCKGIDFSCKWTALLFAIIAAAIALLASNPAGWVLLAAIGGAVVGAGVGFAICGSQAAIIRTWVVIKEDAQIGDYRMVSNHKPVHLTCKLFSNTITFKPNITNEFEALCIFGGNILMTGLEGFMYVYAFRGGGLLIKSPMTFLRNFGTNYLKTLSVNGFIGRSIFSVYGGANAYYMSDTEGFDAGQVAKASAQSFFFAETAAYHAASERDPQSIALLLSMGGIPGGRNGQDAGKGQVAQEAKATAESWKNAAEKVKSGVNKVVDTAKEFREKLRSQEKGNGAHEGLAKLITQRRQQAIDFYQKYYPEMSIDDIRSHISGIDFTKPIEVVELPKGTDLYQYTKVNSEGISYRGDYYTDSPHYSPSELGISDKYNVREGRNYTEEIKTVTQEKVIIEKNVEGLKSTSAPISDTWSLKDQSIPTEGGGSQIYIPKEQLK